MKRVDMDSLMVVHSGETWAHVTPPCSRAMIRFLVRNEDVVTWVQVGAATACYQTPHGF